MNKKEELLKNIKSKLEIFSFKNMSEKFPDFCPCYSYKKQCHKMEAEKLNCFFCFCPEYDNSKEEGGCKRNSDKGKWFFNEKLPYGKVWDCSDCTWPHEKENAEEIIKAIFINKEK